MAKNEIFCFTRIHGSVQCREPVANVFVPAASCTMQLTKSCILGLVQFREPVSAASFTMQLTQSCIIIENVKEGYDRRGKDLERGRLDRNAQNFCSFVNFVFLITTILCLPIIKQTPM